MSCSRNNVVYQVKVCEQEEVAKLEEIKKLQEFNTYERVEDQGQTNISTRWVITQKEGGKKKARLVARGFEEREEVQSDSPTISKSVIRLFFSLCVAYGWNVRTIDIKSAYLQGKDVERDIFIRPPRVMKRKGSYGNLKSVCMG